MEDKQEEVSSVAHETEIVEEVKKEESVSEIPKAETYEETK